METAEHVAQGAPAAPRARIFISYKRDVAPDEPVAMEVYRALSQRHEVFIDQTMLVGTVWAKRIEAELLRADYMICFLSERSINSEMVEAEISAAHHLGRAQGGRPALLPVRLAYRAPFQYPLNAYLDHINWAYWGGPDDTPQLIAQLI